MTREHCVAIIRNLAIIKAIAEGREIYFAQFDCEGRFQGWKATDKVILGSLEAGLYSVKPRYQCMKPGQHPAAIPYPHQASYVNGRMK